jgi:sulfur carrier protein
VRVFVNGAPRDLPDRTTVAALVRDAGAGDPGARGVAVAVDAEVVPRGRWEATVLSEGQHVEVVGAIQGG